MTKEPFFLLKGIFGRGQLSPELTPSMALQPFTNEQLNYFKFASIVLNEFAIALRQTFKSMWDNMFGHRPGYQLWDDSMVVRNCFSLKKVEKPKFLHTSPMKNGIVPPCSRLPSMQSPSLCQIAKVITRHLVNCT